MPIQLNEENGGKMLVVHVSGKLAKADYEHFVPDSSGLSGSTESCACFSTWPVSTAGKPERCGRTSSST